MSIMKGWARIAAVLACIATVSGVRTLVVVDEMSVPTTHSQFFAMLEAQGHTLTVAKADDSDLGLMGEEGWTYDNLALLSPSTEEFGGTLELGEVVRFIDSGRNVLVAISPDGAGTGRKVAQMCGITADKRGGMVQDHFGFDEEDDGTHTLIVSRGFADAPTILDKAAKAGGVLFRGTGLANFGNNPLVIPILTGSSSSYSNPPSEPVQDGALHQGTSTLLVAAMQAKNDARCTAIGSLEMLSDAFFDAKVSSEGGSREPSCNRAFAGDFAEWAFGQKGKLRVMGGLTYRAKGSGTANPPSVRVGEEMEVSAVIEEVRGGAWGPYTAGEVKAELSRIEPFVRTPMRPAGGGGAHVGSLRAPDVTGVFTLRLVHGKAGLSGLGEGVEVSVRPIRHDEHERFLLAAYPYYASALSCVAATFVLGVLFLYGSESKGKEEAEGKDKDE